MLNPLRFRITRAAAPRSNRSVVVVVAAAVIGILAAPAGRPSAQKPTAYLHLNPVIDKLVQGKHVFGVSTSDMSMRNARALASSGIDYVYIDMEHDPVSFREMEGFMAATLDKEAILKKGNAQPEIAVFTRLAPYASEGSLVGIKQALDLGVMGIIFNNLETKEQTLKFVAGMRKYPRKGVPHTGPIGTRGSGGPIAPWFWGVSGEEYSQRADLWPLNPQGDLLMLPMIETITGVKNAAEIAAVPGIGGLYIAGGGDLSTSLGVASSAAPEVEEAKQAVIRVCQSRNIVCGGSLTVPQIPQRLKEGWKILNMGHADGGLNWEQGQILRAGRAALSALGEK